MSDAASEFAAMQAMHASASLHTENNMPVVLLPGFKFRAGTQTFQMALLLHPSAHSGYTTRLFFENKLEGVGQTKNWTLHTVLSRAWWAYSWQNVIVEQPWTSMLCAHLRALS